MHKVLITSQGRTATVSINRALQTLPQVRSYHERKRTDLPFLFYSQLQTFEQLTQEYLIAEDTFAEASSGDFYVAVNPYFRFAGAILEEQFGWRVAHLVRHPKTYLESVYPRRIFTEFDTGLHQLPMSDDPFQAKWHRASRFEKLCWYYAKTLTYFKSSNINWYKYEELTRSTKAINEMMEDLGLPLFAADFKLTRFNSKNALKNKLISLKNPSFKPEQLRWESLSPTEMDTYRTYFEPLAQYFGYDL